MNVDTDDSPLTDDEERAWSEFHREAQEFASKLAALLNEHVGRPTPAGNFGLAIMAARMHAVARAEPMPIEEFVDFMRSCYLQELQLLPLTRAASRGISATRGGDG